MSQEQANPLADPSPAASALLSPEFTPRSFGGEMLWAQGQGFEAKILRVRAGEKVRVSARDRRDMHIMLSGGRACLKRIPEQDAEAVELLPAQAVRIEANQEYRLIAMTDAELLSVYSPIALAASPT